MELRVLKYFLTVAREENITKAAQILHITQPTLSRQLIQLEEELGVKLLKRSGRFEEIFLSPERCVECDFCRNTKHTFPELRIPLR